MSYCLVSNTRNPKTSVLQCFQERRTYRIVSLAVVQVRIAHAKLCIVPREHSCAAHCLCLESLATRHAPVHSTQRAIHDLAFIFRIQPRGVAAIQPDGQAGDGEIHAEDKLPTLCSCPQPHPPALPDQTSGARGLAQSLLAHPFCVFLQPEVPSCSASSDDSTAHIVPVPHAHVSDRLSHPQAPLYPLIQQ